MSDRDHERNARFARKVHQLAQQAGVSSEIFRLRVLHEVWCDQATGIGSRCTCDPTPEIMDFEF